METLVSKDEVRRAVAEARAVGQRIALVPTMGALHEGHLSLVRAAHERAEYVVVSVFVNPTQFGPGEDFEAYPRDLEGDLELLEAEGVALVFAPATATMYDPGATVIVDPGPLGDVLEGAIRPTHFRGVCTVVAKLFGIVEPDLAFFGEKDFQQLAIVRTMVRDLDLPVRVVGCPTIREPDGLAMSSRNVYLSPDERAAATVLYRALRAAEARMLAGERDARALVEVMRAKIATEPLAVPDYTEVADAVTLAPLDALDSSPARALVAARLGSTRLIDNLALEVG
ncbi:MAG: pantoate--beta-alanine ligase [Coriobacteriia bacterium]|nr:pantoate--beta-alanine ligase [Coriobacteriia bacterium]MBN2847247.1 pantoate--beta-alanine ligase [Coriobacteriia bacterium]